MEKTQFIKDANALLNRHNVVSKTFISKQCSTIQLLLNLTVTHYCFITNNSGLLMHETIYHKLVEFHDLIVNRIKTNGIMCTCFNNQPHPEVMIKRTILQRCNPTDNAKPTIHKSISHNMLDYLKYFRTAIPMYNQVYGDYIQSFNHLSSKLNENVTYLIFTYITTIPLQTPLKKLDTFSF